MSSLVQWDEEALEDLRTIWRYIALEDSSPKAADDLVSDIYEKANLYGVSPLLGEQRGDIRRDARIFRHKSFVVVYSSVADGIYIHRVIHGAKDLLRGL